MKSLIFAFMIALGSISYAGQIGDAAKAKSIIKTGNEPKLYVKAFEARGLKCDPIKDEAIKLGRLEEGSASAKVRVFCNEYDADGAPMANVYMLEFEGRVYVKANFFNIDSMVVLPQE